jgi:lipopolysaccharide biosynthesis regulator YciM
MFPKRLIVDYEATMADLYIQMGDRKLAIEHLEKAIAVCKDKRRRARFMFVLAQLYHQQGDGGMASGYYNKVANSPAPYEMQFQAKINKALSATSGGAAIRKELNKMLRDEKNAEFKDQIYYALAEMDMKDGNVVSAKENYSSSVYWSIKNPRQKGISYLRLADLHFEEKDYISAQKYYDSCVKAMPPEYEDYEAIKNKAEGLSDLVFHYETVMLEDSVQRIAGMDPETREKFLKKTLKDIEDAAALKKFQDEQRQLALQSKVNTTTDAGGTGSKWYFYNLKVKGSGFNDYRAQWGTRPLEDNWRRSNKTSFTFDEGGTDSLETDVNNKDSLTVDDLLANIPLTPADIDSSNNRLMNSLYMLGIIYKEQLKEESEAVAYFNQVINRGVEHPRVLASLYQLYLIHQKKGSPEAENYKQQILQRYPDSEIAKLMLDPDYLKKKEEESKKELNDYAATLQYYKDRNYGAVIYKCNEVIAYDSTNKYINKYYLLKAFAISKTDPGNTAAISSPLEQLYAKAPATEEGKQAKIYLDKVKSGVSIVDPDTIVDNPAPSEYTLNLASPHLFVLVYPTDNGNVEAGKIKMSNFNNEFFRSKRYSVAVTPFNDASQLIIVKTFANADEAGQFMMAFKSSQSKVTLGTMAADFQSFVITSANFTQLLSAKDQASYVNFYQANYP